MILIITQLDTWSSIVFLQDIPNIFVRFLKQSIFQIFLTKDSDRLNFYYILNKEKLW